MKHYVCPICGGVSQNPGVCQTPGCTHEGHELVECNCTDGTHADVLKKPSATDTGKCEHCGKICKGDCAVEPYKEELSA